MSLRSVRSFFGNPRDVEEAPTSVALVVMTSVGFFPGIARASDSKKVGNRVL